MSLVDKIHEGESHLKEFLNSLKDKGSDLYHTAVDYLAEFMPDRNFKGFTATALSAIMLYTALNLASPNPIEKKKDKNRTEQVNDNYQIINIPIQHLQFPGIESSAMDIDAVPDGNIYASSFAGWVSVIDPYTNTVIADITPEHIGGMPVWPGLHALELEAGNEFVYVANSTVGHTRLHKLDVSTNSLISSSSDVGAIYDVMVKKPNERLIYFSEEDSTSIKILDVVSDLVTSKEIGFYAGDMVFNKTGDTLYVYGEGKVHIMDPSLTQTFGEIPVYPYIHQDMVITPDNQLIFMSDKSNYLYRVDLSTRTCTDLYSSDWLYGLAVDKNGEFLYAVNKSNKLIEKIDIASSITTKNIVETINISDAESLEEIILGPFEKNLYVTDKTANSIYAVIFENIPPVSHHPWPMFRHDSQRTGRSPFIGPQANSILWILDNSSYGFSSPVVNSDNVIYSIADNINNNIYLSSVSLNGGFIWNKDIDGTGTGSLSPGIDSEDNIYAGSQKFIDPSTIIGKLYSFQPNGTLRWNLLLGIYDHSYINSSPVISLEDIIYTSTPSFSHSVNSDGSVNWSLNNHLEDPAISNDGSTIYGVYHGTAYNNALIAIESNGTQKWITYFGDTINDLAVGHDETIYVCSEDENLYAVNPDGSIKWTFPADGNVVHLAVDTDNKIYFGTKYNFPNTMGSIYAVTSTGTMIWRKVLDGGVSSPLTLDADHTLYFGQSIYLFAVDKTDGSTIWTQTTPGPGYYFFDNDITIIKDNLLLIAAGPYIFTIGSAAKISGQLFNANTNSSLSNLELELYRTQQFLPSKITTTDLEGKFQFVFNSRDEVGGPTGTAFYRPGTIKVTDTEFKAKITAQYLPEDFDEQKILDMDVYVYPDRDLWTNDGLHEFFFLEKPEEINPNKNPLVLVHGLNGTSGYWDELEEPLAQLNYDVWKFYYPKDQEINKSADLLGDGIETILANYNSGKKVNITTHSMGCLVTAYHTTSDDYNENIDNVLMLAAPYHGSEVAAKVTEANVPTELLLILAEILGFSVDKDAPAYKDLSPASDLVLKLNKQYIYTNLVNYLALAGTKGMWQLNYEAPNHQDGLVSITSASLLEKGIPLALMEFNHSGTKGKGLDQNELNGLLELIDSYFQGESYNNIENNVLNTGNNINIILPSEIPPNTFSNAILDRGSLQLEFFDSNGNPIDDTLYLFNKNYASFEQLKKNPFSEAYYHYNTNQSSPYGLGLVLQAGEKFFLLDEQQFTQDALIDSFVIQPLRTIMKEYHQVNHLISTLINQENGVLSLFIPANALPENKTISIEQKVMDVPGENIGFAYDLNPDNLAFSTPATLTYHYNENLLGGHNEEDILLYTYDSQTGGWKAVENQTKNTNANTITAPLNHLSLYTLGVELTDVEEEKEIPKEFQLYQNYPNPFNNGTKIEYDIPANMPRESDIEITIYNILGQAVKHFNKGNQQPGTYSLMWDGKDDKGNSISSGIYLYRIEAGQFKDTKKMVLLK